MKVKRLQVSFFSYVLFFCTLQFRVLFRVLNPNLCRNTNTREAKLYARGGTYTFERDERLLRGDYIDKTHARAQNTHNRASTLLLLFEASAFFVVVSRVKRKEEEKRKGHFSRDI